MGWDLHRQGYQRAPNEKHFIRIANFLKEEGNPLLPTSALLAAREEEYGKLEFISDNTDHPEIGRLLLPEPRILFIVDYQHRWRGIRHAVEHLKCELLLNFEVPVIIMADVSRYEEIRQFYLINSKQKRVDTDLGLALLQTMATVANDAELLNFVGPGNKYRIRDTRLTFNIASKNQGPWVAKIMDPNMTSTGNQVVSIKSFVDSLHPLLTRTSPVHMKRDDDLIKIILDYWSAIEQLMPNAFASPQNYSIQRAIGVFVMHRVAAKRIFRGDDLSTSKIAQILAKAKKDYLNERFWEVGGEAKNNSSASGQKELAEKIMQVL